MNREQMNEYVMTSERFHCDETEITVWTTKELEVGDKYKMDGIWWVVDKVVRRVR